MKISKKQLFIVGVISTVILSSGAVYAITSLDFATRAQTWVNDSCNQALILSKNNTNNNEKAAICYSYFKLIDHDQILNSHQESINDLIATDPVPGPKGDPGDIGPVGPVGPQGPAGQSVGISIFDANDNLLGPLVTVENDGATPQFMHPELKKSVIIRESYDGTTYTARLGTQILNRYYATSDCSGDAYIVINRGNNEWGAVNKIYTTTMGNHFTIDPPSYKSVQSFREYENTCQGMTPADYYLGKLNIVNLNLSEPLPMPWRYGN